ncbi:MAG: hypothetical protein IJY42_00165, partial [Clostridia bacterium]|nr:hypothetical protein [Clostridia bacterium]
AVYLSSFATPFEVAVFWCYSRTDARRIGQMLLRRADTLKVNLKLCGLYETYGERICVTVKGRCAVLVLSEIPVTAREVCRLL